MQHAAVGLVSGALILASIPAMAQSPVDSRSARADRLVQQGRALLEAGQVEAACARFADSAVLENRLGTLLELGDCNERAGRSASAWHDFLAAEAVARVQKDVERAQLAAQRAAALEPKLVRIVFLVPMTSRVPGLSVRLGANTVPSSSWGSRIPVDPGMQRVSAAAKGYDSWAVDIDASQGGREFRVNVPTLAPARGAADPNARGRAYRTAGVVTGSVGLAGLGAGAVFTAMARNANDAKSCANGSPQCTPSPNKSGFSDAAAVSFALGGTLVATGVTLFVFAPGPDHKQETALRVAARYASSGGRLQLEGAW